MKRGGISKGGNLIDNDAYQFDISRHSSLKGMRVVFEEQPNRFAQCFLQCSRRSRHPCNFSHSADLPFFTSKPFYIPHIDLYI